MQPGVRAREDRCMKRRQGYSCRRFMSFLWGWGIAGVWRGARLLLRPCGSGFFSPAEDGRALYVHAELGGFGEYAPRQCGFLRFGCIAEIGFRRADVLGVDEREFARFGMPNAESGSSCRSAAVRRSSVCVAMVFPVLVLCVDTQIPGQRVCPPHLRRDSRFTR